VQYDTAPGGFWAGGRPAWVHGYPLAEEHLMRIMDDLSFFNARTDTINVLSLEDPELFKYPLAYIIEVGWWTLTDAGAAALRTYIEKAASSSSTTSRSSAGAASAPAAGNHSSAT